MAPVELFQQVSGMAPHPRFQRRPHPQPPKSVRVQPGRDNELTKPPLQTNKFYSNLYLGNQDQGVFMCPYVLWWNRGAGDHYGLAIGQTSKDQRVYGPDNTPNPQYMFHPIGIRSISLSAFEFDKTMRMELSEMLQFSVTADFYAGPAHGTDKILRVPIVLGTGFITGSYFNLIPRFCSAVGFKSFTQKPGPRKGIQKYVIELHDNTTWVLYASIPQNESFELQQEDGSTLTATQRVKGVMIQIAKLSPGSEKHYDNHAGKYAVRAQISGTANDRDSVVRINWSSRQPCNSDQLILFALPHHISAFTQQMKKAALGFSLDTQSKGTMWAYSAKDFYMNERLPIYLRYMPWSSMPNAPPIKYSNETLRLIHYVASAELQQDMFAQINLNSMYFAGKALDKFAYICFVAFEILKDQQLAIAGLEKLKAAFQMFVCNQQQFPLYYDTTFKGIVSSGACTTGNSLEDFGNSYYNDHHFHYGYFIHAAAIIGYIDSAMGGSWVYDNKHYINMLVRDIANPSEQDPYFPVSRSFDWFHGHSWAKGLFESGDGKDQESTSEDYHHALAIKLWGSVVKDKSMEARGAVMLSIMKRSFGTYFLLDDKNNVQDEKLKANRVAGILFENKIDHTTYFSSRIECIQGIHMLPLSPASSYMRSPDFCNQEWQSLLAHIAGSIDDGWKGILFGNLALFDPRSSFEFFADKRFQNKWLDGGASRTWYLAYAAGVGGAVA
ncbi:endo-1,3(4)-beta-glucanase [Lipomyces arxii]|uniref:endo-1,3(4)-beta-glucanase n=1 Tax=Lipomyces arxii TaxID=56418 RepID=UPI0034CEA9C4